MVKESGFDTQPAKNILKVTKPVMKLINSLRLLRFRDLTDQRNTFQCTKVK